MLTGSIHKIGNRVKEAELGHQDATEQRQVELSEGKRSHSKRFLAS